MSASSCLGSVFHRGSEFCMVRLGACTVAHPSRSLDSRSMSRTESGHLGTAAGRLGTVGCAQDASGRRPQSLEQARAPVPLADIACLGCRTSIPLPRGGSANTFRTVVVVPAQEGESMVREMRTAGAIETLVIDRQPLFLAALGALLVGPPMSARVTTCPRSDMAVEIIRSRQMDLVFCEVQAEPISGPALIRLLDAEQLVVPVILLGDHGDTQTLTEALQSPAAGLFTKDANLDEFLVGVRAVLSGHRAIGARLMGQVLSRLAQQPAAESKRTGSQLSRTELEILAMIGQAESIPAIAASRGISSKTVRNHLAKIYRKLELHGRTEAMLFAARLGLTSR